jgi:hypothetical protein
LRRVNKLQNARHALVLRGKNSLSHRRFATRGYRSKSTGQAFNRARMLNSRGKEI